MYPGGSMNDRLASGPHGDVIYLDTAGVMARYGTDGALLGKLQFTNKEVVVIDPQGGSHEAFERTHAGAVAVDSVDTVWYVDLASNRLVHLKM
jgi:hypothetical protein